MKITGRLYHLFGEMLNKTKVLFLWRHTEPTAIDDIISIVIENDSLEIISQFESSLSRTLLTLDL